MVGKLREMILVALTLTLLALILTQLARAECDMWAWIAPDSLSDSAASAFTESVKWYRYVSQGLSDDGTCDDGWSVWGEAMNGDIDFRLSDLANSTPPYGADPQVYDDTWNDQDEGFDYTWPPNIPYENGYGPAYYLTFALSHSRAAGTLNSDEDTDDPHPFVYDLGGRTLAMQHNGAFTATPQSIWISQMRDLIEDPYWYMPIFLNRTFNGTHAGEDTIDSEIYGILLMKNVLLADNYGLGDVWAMERTVNQLQGTVAYTALNMYFFNDEYIYAMCEVGSGTSHDIWRAFNLTGECATIVTGDNAPGYGPPTWNYWETATQITSGNWYRIDRDLGDDSGTLGTATLPTTGEYTYLGRNPMVGKDAALDVGPYHDYVATWSDAGVVYYNYLDQMGLCERVPIDLTGDTEYDHGNADLAFCSPSTSNNDFYVVYERAPTGETANQIILRKLVYNSSTLTWTPQNPVVVNTNSTAVKNPAVVCGDGKVVIVWEQERATVQNWHIRAAAYSFDGTSVMSDRIVGDTTSTKERHYPDVEYLGQDYLGDPVFVIAFTVKDRSGTDHGMHLARFNPESPPALIPGYESYGFAANPGNTRPALVCANISEATAYRYVCAFRESPSDTTHRLVGLGVPSYLLSSPPANWYLAADTGYVTLETRRIPSEVSARFYEVSLDKRGNEGYVEAAYSYYDHNMDPTQYEIKSVEFDPSMTPDTPERIDESAATTDIDPAIVRVPWQSENHRLVLWDGYIDDDGATCLTAKFYPTHFDTDLDGWRDGFASVDQGILPTEPILLTISPNPFNPDATLRYTLPEASWVKVEVFDVSGRLVATPAGSRIAQRQTSGDHKIVFDGSALPSGIYFARLTANRSSTTQKLLLLK